MGQLRQPAQAFSVEGEVVEILQDVGRLRAKVVLRPGTVLDVPAIPSDLHLGDQVGIEGAITLEADPDAGRCRRVRVRQGHRRAP